MPSSWDQGVNATAVSFLCHLVPWIKVHFNQTFHHFLIANISWVPVRIFDINYSVEDLHYEFRQNISDLKHVKIHYTTDTPKSFLLSLDGPNILDSIYFLGSVSHFPFKILNCYMSIGQVLSVEEEYVPAISRLPNLALPWT